MKLFLLIFRHCFKDWPDMFCEEIIIFFSFSNNKMLSIVLLAGMKVETLRKKYTTRVSVEGEKALYSQPSVG